MYTDCPARTTTEFVRTTNNVMYFCCGGDIANIPVMPCVEGDVDIFPDDKCCGLKLMSTEVHECCGFFTCKTISILTSERCIICIICIYTYILYTSWLPGFARAPSFPPYLLTSLRPSVPPSLSPPFSTSIPPSLPSSSLLPLPPHSSLLPYSLPPSSQLPPFQLPYSYLSPSSWLPSSPLSSLPPSFLLPTSSLPAP